ncbi:hypothetical protein pb186bvf_007516 [Paramecium bursaria]
MRQHLYLIQKKSIFFVFVRRDVLLIRCPKLKIKQCKLIS